jgi:putative ABC transport system permease protein
MYPGLTAPLGVLLAIAFSVLGVAALRRPTLRRLALRQIARRRTEAALVISGSLLGTAIIVGALVVGDTLGFSVRQTAFHTLGPIDERVVSTTAEQGQVISANLSHALAGDHEVDGLLSATFQQGAALRVAGATRLAEPRVWLWELGQSEGPGFGAAQADLAPRPNSVILNQNLAFTLKAHQGDAVTLYLSGQPRSFLVQRVVAARGVAGTGFGATENRNAFLPSGTLASTSPDTHAVTWISNRGGVTAGATSTATAAAKIRTGLGPLAGKVAVETPKREVLLAAERTGDSLGGLFLMIGSFSIIAGALLLVNIFVMLADERKGQLGMLRAVGLKRSGVVGAFTLEGAIYALVATGLGVVAGLGVGRGVAFLAAKIFSSWSADGTGLDVTFSVSGTSLVNGAALGLTISLATVLLTSTRISRFNIIAAIRDLESHPVDRHRRRRLVLSTTLAGLLAAVAVPTVLASQGVGTLLLPSLAMLCTTPLLQRVLSRSHARSVVSTAVLLWALLANLVRPRIYDTASMSIYVVLGCLLAFSAVVLLSENQQIVLRPLRRLLGRPSENALSVRLGLAFPLSNRFRTGATLSMYTLIMLVLVLLAEMGGVLHQSVDEQVRSSTSGYDLRLDVNPAAAPSPLSALTAPAYANRIQRVTQLTTAFVRSSDPGHRTSDAIDTVLVGVPGDSVSDLAFAHRLTGLDTDAAVWHAVETHTDYVVVDPFFGATGGPGGQYYAPGDTFSVIDPQTGVSHRKTIAGVLRNATVFYVPNRPASFPAITSSAAVTAQFSGAAASSALVRTTPGAHPAQMVTELQGEFLSASLVATPLEQTIRKLFDANLAFFRLMQGFLALGLLVSITGLGVVMVRAVRERRRTIGVLRALGFRAGAIERSFLVESGFVAFEGVVLGAFLGVLTTWLMYQKSAVFDGIREGFPILWGTVTWMASAAVLGSLLATWSPARHAARVLPAVATRSS